MTPLYDLENIMENKMNDKLDKVRDLLVDKIFKSRSNWSLEEMEENGFNNSGEMIDVLYKKSIKDLEVYNLIWFGLDRTST